MSYYDKHVFFCCNHRDGERESCGPKGSEVLRAYCKAKILRLGMSGEGKVRVNTAGCLDRCEEGPTVVVYPEGVWYRIENKKDVDELVEHHLVGGKIVKRLQI